MNHGIPLNAHDTDLVLTRAAQGRAQAQIESAAFHGPGINGFLRSRDDDALLFEITGKPAIEPATLIHARCRVYLFCESRYYFESAITAVPCWGERRSVALSCPTTIRELERRRSSRAALAPSSTVTLAHDIDGQTHRWTANLLNISPDGLACKTAGAAGDAVALGANVELFFRLPGADGEFKLGATVSNRTPTRDGGVIVGLHFVQEPRFDRQLESLRAQLARGEHTGASRPRAVVGAATE